MLPFTGVKDWLEYLSNICVINWKTIFVNGSKKIPLFQNLYVVLWWGFFPLRVCTFKVLERIILISGWFFKALFSMSSVTSADRTTGTSVFHNYMAVYGTRDEEWDCLLLSRHKIIPHLPLHTWTFTVSFFLIVSIMFFLTPRKGLTPKLKTQLIPNSLLIRMQPTHEAQTFSLQNKVKQSHRWLSLNSQVMYLIVPISSHD